MAARFVQYCVEYSCIALLYYDYSLTWTREVKYIWTSRYRTSTALYIACRYAMISNVIFLLSFSGKLPRTISCDTGYKICSALSTVGRIGLLTVLGMRPYTLYGRSKYILAIFASIGITIFVVDVMHVRLISCVPRHKKNIYEILVAILVVIYEVFSAAFVILRAWQAMRIRNDIKFNTNQLERLLLQQGILYFCFVSIFTFGALVLLYTAPSGSHIQRLLNGFVLPISGLMGARFLLYLRECNHKVEGGSEDKISQPIMLNHEHTVSSEDDERPFSNNTHLQHGDLIDEFGQDPVRQAKMERRNAQDEEFALS